MVSAGACFGEKGRLHLIPNKAKVNAKLYVETLLPELVQDCRSVLPSGFIFQLHTRLSWLKTGLVPTAVISLVKMNGLRTRLTLTLWTTMSGELCLNATCHFNPAGEYRWAQESSAVDMGPAATRLDQQSHTELDDKTWACVKAGGVHFEHTLKWTTCEILVFDSQCLLTMKITSCCWLFHAELKIWHRIFIQP